MNEAAKILLTYTNFKCFSRSNTDVRTYNCDVLKAEWLHTNQLFTIHITADRFLRNMVRAIVGTLIEVGKGNVSIEEFKKIIESKDRREAGTSIDAHALYLSKVEYDFNSKK